MRLREKVILVIDDDKIALKLAGQAPHGDLTAKGSRCR